MSQKGMGIWAAKLDIDDPRLPELQAIEHAEHVKIALSYRRKQYSKQKAARQLKCSSKELADIIDANAKILADNIKGAFNMNARKRKAMIVELLAAKRRRVTLGKYRLKRVKLTEKANILKCFDRRGGPSGRVHTHQWWALTRLVASLNSLERFIII
ncbi:hypothetical protein PTTG_26912 [Puccinia triticina 1-1 BBBD Race 1]|uniref:Uncharacterized protein n=1 Tax=Puccinia triticina (isolate 1-1 / race 1 (BBBD)) TaxID=630390 RepID=A0A180GR06_PUCT1|nr:hypothetical protein PTTG_26912 [Puccinia triticina 1-1 BBBD Race 1]